MKEVTIFCDIITDQYVTDRHYFEEMIMNKRAFDFAEEGMSPVNERYDVQQYPIEQFSRNRILEGQFNPDGRQAYQTETFYYVATKQFKEKFKIFFDAHNALKNENAINKYYRESLSKENAEYLKKIFDYSNKLTYIESMNFWSRLKFLFKREIMK